MKKLDPKIKFNFDSQEDVPVLNFEIKNFKKRKQLSKIQINKNTKNRKVQDASTKLF